MKPEEQKHFQESVGVDEHHHLILMNDDYNTVDFVIDILMEECGHDFEQAYQCTLIAHHKGKCDIKKGSMEYLRTLKLSILDKGVGVTIE